MLSRLKKIHFNNKKIIENFSYLTLLQIFTLLFPFITYPYLIRVLGFNIYGSVIFAQTIAVNVAVIINFGFNISGTKDIARNRDNLKDLSKIVSSVYSIKFFLWFACLLVYFSIIYFVPFLRKDWSLYIISFFLTFNELLFPTWFFQGLEKMKYITFINISVRLLFVIAIFVFVKDKTDYLIVPILNAIGALMGGLAALYVVFVKEKISFIKQSYLVLKSFFIDSYPLFISSLSIQVYVNVSKLLVGAFLGMREVAIYDLAEKISIVFKVPINMISQATFPKISREKKVSFINRVMLITVGFTVIAFLFLFFFTDYIIYFLTGEYNIVAKNIVLILSLSSILVAFNIFLGSNRLIPFNLEKIFLRNTIYSCMFFLIAVSFLVFINEVNVYTISYMTLLTESFTFILCLYIANKHKLLFNN